MELLRHVVVLLHIVGFAITFGAWTAEAAAKRFRFTRTMDYGLLLSLLTGLALAAPWPAGIELNYPKIGVKLVILVVIGGVLGMAAHVNGAPAIRLRVRCLFRSGCSHSRRLPSPSCGELSADAPAVDYSRPRAERSRSTLMRPGAPSSASKLSRSLIRSPRRVGSSAACRGV